MQVWTKKYKIHCHSTNFIKDWQSVTQQGSTELYSLYIAADSIDDTISFITGVLFCDPKTSLSQIRLWSDLSFYIRPGPAPATFEKVKSGATLYLTSVLQRRNSCSLTCCLKQLMHFINVDKN